MTSKQLWGSASIAALLIVILVALGIVGGGDKTEPGNTEHHANPLPAGTKTVKVQLQSADSAQLWQGTVQSRLAARMASKINARILDVMVHAGDRVKKGQPLVKLDDRDLRAAHQAAQAAVAATQAQAGNAESEARRMSDLFSKQAATKQSLEAVQAQAKAARALTNQAASSAQQAQVALSDGVLLAPFDAVVAERLKEPGDMANPGEALLTLYQPDQLRLELALPSRCMNYVHSGVSLPVRFAEQAAGETALVDEIVPQIDRATDTQIVKLRLPSVVSLQPGQTGWAALACQADQHGLLIPQSAVLHYGQLQAVKVVHDNQFSVRHVRLGKTIGAQVEVLSGLHDGETIVEVVEAAP